MYKSFEVQQDVSLLLYKWAAERTDEVIFNPKNGYYSFGIVADAFQKGMDKGTDHVHSQIREKFVSKGALLVNALEELINRLGEKKYAPSKVFIDHALQNSRILLTVSPDVHHAKEFISFAYSVVSDIEEKYDKSNNLLLTFSFVDEIEDLNTELIKADGYEIAYDLTTKTPIV